MSKIAITDYINDPSIERSILGDLVGNEVGEDTEVLLVWHEKIDEAFLNKCPKLRGVQRYGVGYDNLHLPALEKHGIIACNNPDYGVDEVSDTAIAMIVNISRGVSFYNARAKSYVQTWQENVQNSLRRHSDMVVGIVGAGRIGGSVAIKAKALGFQAVIFDPFQERGYEKMLGVKRVDRLETLLNMADIVSLHAPLSEDTAGMVNNRFIEQMKKGASLVNTARGGLFSGHDVLFDALKSGHIASLATDVLPSEPPSDNNLINAWRNSEEWLEGRLIVNPHTSYFSQQSIVELRTNAAKNALRLFKGKQPHNLLTSV